MTAVKYTRDFDKSRNLAYERKFDEFLKLCDDTASGGYEVVIIAYPEVLGDNYDELLRNLSRAAEAGLLVAISGASPGNIPRRH
jgi:hypothetical protein